MRPLLLLTLAALPARAQSQPEMVAIIVGANVGAPDDDPLRYAESDARRLRAALVELGVLKAERALLVLEGGPAELRQALDEARGRVAELTAAGHSATLLFYFSGHGDEGALHLPRGIVTLTELRAQIDRIPAGLRLSFLDSCRSPGRQKGVRRGPAFAVGASPDQPRGTIEIRASAEGEGAQESEELGGAIFTHYLVSALRGAADSDRDGQVTLAEAYAYAFRRTLFRTGDAASLQHPSLTASLAGAGELVLTRPSRADSTLEVPKDDGADRYLVFALPSAAVVAEISGDGVRTLALPSGRYLVARRRGASAAVAEIDLWGGRRTLRPNEFRAYSREELAARGGHIELRRNHLDVDAGVEVAPGAAEGPALFTLLSFSHTRGLLELRAGLGYAAGPLSTPSAQGWSHSLIGRLSGGVRLLLGRVSLTGALGLALRYSWEGFTRRDSARLAAAGLSPDGTLASGAIGPALTLRLGVPLPRHLAVAVQAAFDALLRNETNGATTALAFRPVIDFTAGLTYAF